MFSIDKLFLKFFSKQDPDKDVFKARFAELKAKFPAHKEEYPFVVKHATGCYGVLGFQLTWALLLQPIEAIPEGDQTKGQKRTLRRVAKAWKAMGMEHKHIAVPLEATAKERLELMRDLYQG